MIILGLTGSIASGKSTAAAMFRELDIPVHDADECVHRLYAPGGAAVGPVSRHFPESLSDGAIDRRALGTIVLSKPDALRLLEAIVHPLVQAEEEIFLATCFLQREKIAVLDIPLLFETGAEERCDYVATVTVPALLQRRRIMSRPGMTEAKMRGILSRQWPDRKKRRHADFILHSAYGFDYTRREIKRLVHQLRTGWIHA